MASWQSKLTNLFLRLTVKRRFDPQVHPSTVRARVNRLASRFNKPRDWIKVTPASANGVLAEWIDVTHTEREAHADDNDNAPRTNELPGKVLLYLHGGGYIVCSPLTHRYMVARICRASGLRALVIDYRLAPEHPFPAGLEDAEAAYRWLLATGYDAKDIVIAGDSAGGGLTLSLLLTLREKGMEMPAGAALLSPWTDLALTGWSMLTKAGADPMLRMDGASLAVKHYLQDIPPTHPIASPLYATLAGLPPLFVQVGDREILLDDSQRLVDKARNQGVDAQLEIWPGMAHVFQAFANLPESREAVARIGAFLNARASAKPANAQQATSAAMPTSATGAPTTIEAAE